MAAFRDNGNKQRTEIVARTILLVDNDDGSREASAAILRRAGFEVLESKLFSAAFKAAINSRPDAVVLDFLIYTRAAPQLHKAFRRLVPRERWIVIARGDNQISSAMSECSNRILFAPFSPDELIGMVKEVLAGASSNSGASDN